MATAEAGPPTWSTQQLESFGDTLVGFHLPEGERLVFDASADDACASGDAAQDTPVEWDDVTIIG